MAGELRWILLALSALLLVGIAWWGARRSRQAPGNAQLRESAAAPTYAAPADHAPMEAGNTEPQAWGVPPFEPLAIRTADFDPVPIVDMSMTATSPGTDPRLDTGEDPLPGQAATPPAAATPPPAARAPMTALAPATAASAATPAQTANASESQCIVTIRVSAQSDALWDGATLMAALEKHGLGYGRYKVFHHKHLDGRTLFCAASLVEPGTFDPAKMPEQEFRGLTLFAVLPGPADPLQTVDMLMATAVELAETLRGTVQDSTGAPLTAQRAGALREDVARFQASITLH